MNGNSRRYYEGGLSLYAYEKVKDREVGNHEPLKVFRGPQPGGDQWHTYSLSYTPDQSVEVSRSIWCDQLTLSCVMNSVALWIH